MKYETTFCSIQMLKTVQCFFLKMFLGGGKMTPKGFFTDKAKKLKNKNKK